MYLLVFVDDVIVHVPLRDNQRKKKREERRGEKREREQRTRKTWRKTNKKTQKVVGGKEGRARDDGVCSVASLSHVRVDRASSLFLSPFFSLSHPLSSRRSSRNWVDFSRNLVDFSSERFPRSETDKPKRRETNRTGPEATHQATKPKKMTRRPRTLLSLSLLLVVSCCHWLSFVARAQTYKTQVDVSTPRTERTQEVIWAFENGSLCMIDRLISCFPSVRLLFFCSLVRARSLSSMFRVLFPLGLCFVLP